MGYLNNLELTEKAFDEEGWMYTGDMGKFDKVGCCTRSGKHTRACTLHCLSTCLQLALCNTPCKHINCVFLLSVSLWNYKPGIHWVTRAVNSILM